MPSLSDLTPEQGNQLAKDLAGMEHDPLGFVMYAFPWGQPGTELERYKGPDKWQRDYLRDYGNELKYNKNKKSQLINNAVVSGHGVGKAANKSLVIDTPNGKAVWGTIKPGDFVFGRDGKATKVIATHEQGVRDIYKVTFDDGSYTTCDGDHLWSVRGRKERRNHLEDYRELTTKEIVNLGVRRSNGKTKTKTWEIPTQEPVEYQFKETPIHPYLMGVWLGDGCKGQPTYTKPYLEVKEKIEKLGYIIRSDRNNKVHRLQGIFHFFKYGVFIKGSSDRYIPEEYKYNTVKVRRHVLEGLLDTDGECSKNGSVIFSTTSIRLRDDISWLARSLGCKVGVGPAEPSSYKKDGVKVKCHDYYRVYINIDWNPFTVKHKKDRWHQTERRYHVRWIDSIEFSHREDAMCITVEAKDGLYLANDFIVTHNSSMVAWIILWGLCTSPQTRIVVTANTDTQLRTKTSPELGKWYNLAWFAPLLFTYTATSLYSTDKGQERSWRADFIPWSASSPASFAGTHNKGNRLILIMDESSEIPEPIWEVVDGATTDEYTEISFLVFGNPTQATGRFRECFRKYRHRWNNYHVDSRESSITNKALLKQWGEDWGEDSDFFKIRVRGVFPSSAWNQLIPDDAVTKAVANKYKKDMYIKEPIIFGVDLARFGSDGNVLVVRQGRKILDLIKWKLAKTDFSTMDSVGKIIEQIHIYKPDIVFLDSIGVGGPIADRLRQLVDRDIIIDANVALPAMDSKKYMNRRAEVWFLMKEALVAGMDIPADDELVGDLAMLSYGFDSKNRLRLESKKDLPKSPDTADALSLTWFFPVESNNKEFEVEVEDIHYNHAGTSWQGA